MKPEKSKNTQTSDPSHGLVYGLDYYFNEAGDWVFTAEYHLKRGHCCGNGCKHCPYGNARPR